MRLSFQFTYGIFADDFESFVPYIKPELLEEAKKVFAEDSDLTFKYFNNSSIEAFKDCLRLLRYTDEEQLFDMADAFTFMVVIDSPCVDDEEYYEGCGDFYIEGPFAPGLANAEELIDDVVNEREFWFDVEYTD